MRKYKKILEEKKGFDKLVCDMCGAETKKDYWIDNVAAFNITIKKELAKYIERCAWWDIHDKDYREFERSFDLCPDCFNKIEEIIKKGNND